MYARITPDAIDTADVLGRVAAPSNGAAVLFIGTVRDENEGRRVHGMRYDAYVDMAERVLGEIAAEAGRRAGVDHIAVVHRIGELALGDVSVAIAVGAPHRAESFDAARWIIEQIKVRLPVWKQEHYAGGESEWLAGTVPPAVDRA